MNTFVPVNAAAARAGGGGVSATEGAGPDGPSMAAASRVAMTARRMRRYRHTVRLLLDGSLSSVAPPGQPRKYGKPRTADRSPHRPVRPELSVKALPGPSSCWRLGDHGERGRCPGGEGWSHCRTLWGDGRASWSSGPVVPVTRSPCWTSSSCCARRTAAPCGGRPADPSPTAADCRSPRCARRAEERGQELVIPVRVRGTGRGAFVVSRGGDRTHGQNDLLLAHQVQALLVLLDRLNGEAARTAIRRT